MSREHEERVHLQPQDMRGNLGVVHHNSFKRHDGATLRKGAFLEAYTVVGVLEGGRSTSSRASSAAGLAVRSDIPHGLHG